jgi:DNA repair exonuclease SbcCD nuclease subunit
MADMHLGYRQYDLEQRFLDFGHTFKKIAEYAIAHKVDFMLISGDLFDKRSINAPTFVQANHVLSMLKESGIPCIAIEGNHDRSLYKDKMSWLESLDEQGVKLLRVIKNLDGNLMGDYVDIDKTRIFGYGFGGSLTSNAIPLISNEIKEINSRDPPDYTILMMHAGVRGKMKYGIMGEVTYEDLYPLKDVIDYLALGHYHSAYDIDGWVYNPGSPDTCSIVESDEFTEVGEPKGFYHNTDEGVKLITPPIRKFVILRVRADVHKNAETLLADIHNKLMKLGKYEGPMVNIIIEGTLNFDKSHLDMDTIVQFAKERTGALYVDVRFDLLNDEFYISRLESNAFDRPSIEREVFRKLARSDSILAGNSDLFADSLSEVKDLAAKGADEHTMDAVLRRVYNEARAVVPNKTTVELAAIEPIKPEPEIKIKPVKRSRKKAQRPGQAAFDWGENP